MSVIDIVTNAKQSLKGSQTGIAIAKATSREIIGPKKKHVDYLIHALEVDNVNIPELGNNLFERCGMGHWVIVFKALITSHHLLSAGNERFIQYCASRTVTWEHLHFLDKTGVQGYDMSLAIRRYAQYLNAKTRSYREMGYDFCRVPRGKENGVLRNADVQKLLKALPVIQNQVDSLVNTEIRSTDLTNGVITAAFMLLFKDLIRLFACYNDGIINLLEKFFDMKKLECRLGLDIYKKFIKSMEKVSEILKAAEDVGIDKQDIPDLTKVPASLLEALENHLQALEKGKTTSPPTVAISLPTISVNSNSGTSADPFKSDSTDFGNTEYLEQEKKALEMFEKNKQQGIKVQSSSPPKQADPPVALAAPPPLAAPPALTGQSMIQDQAKAPPKKSTSAADDLLQLNPTFAAVGHDSSYSRSTSYPLFEQSTWATQNPLMPNGTTQSATTNPFMQNNNDFAAFNSQSSGRGMDLLGDVLEPMPAAGENPKTQNTESEQSTDINSSLARITKSLDDLSVNANTQKAASQKGQHQWKPQQPQVKTGGANFQNFGPARSTIPPATSQPGWGANVPPAGYSQPVGFPSAAPPYGYPQPGTQPGMRMGAPGPSVATQSSFGFGATTTHDPFGPIPGSQARF